MNTLKWEVKKHALRLRWLIIPLMIMVGILFLIPVPAAEELSHSTWSTALSAISLFVVIVVAYLIIVYPSLAIVIDIVQKYCLLEKLDSESFFVTGIVKTILNVTLVLIGAGLFLLASQAIHRFDTESISFLIVELRIPFSVILVSTAILFPTLALFSCMLAGSIKKLQSHFLSNATIIFVITVWIFILASNLPAAGTIISYGMAAVAFAISCWLYDNKYEITNI